MMMLPGGISFTAWRTWFPSNAGNPRKSALTIATRVSPCANTSARTVNSPAFRVTRWDGPTPPLTGNKGSGVTVRTAIPARNSAAALKARKQTSAGNNLEFIAGSASSQTEKRRSGKTESGAPIRILSRGDQELARAFVQQRDNLWL